MKINGIIAEYNPFHNGHLYHLEESRRLTGADYTVLSWTSWAQSAICASEANAGIQLSFGRLQPSWPGSRKNTARN